MRRTARKTTMRKFRTEYFIAQRLASSEAGQRNGVMTRIAMCSVAIGMAVMIVALAVIAGFKYEITSKLVGFGAHLQVVNLDGNNSYETAPVDRQQPFLAGLSSIPDFKAVYPYAIKGGIVRTEEAMQGVLLKGVDEGYDWNFFTEHLVHGALPRIGDTVRHKDLLISETLARELQLDVEDPVEMLFIRDGAMPRRDRFKVCGIYATGFDEMDRVAVVTDLRNVQRLNDWDTTQVSGFEITTTRFDRLDRFADEVFGLVVDSQTEDSQSLMVVSVRQRYPNIFDWLGAHDVNATVVIVIMLLVALLNMISALLIILLERTSMIGVLKTLGMSNRAVQKIFLIRSIYIIGKGLLWGNVIGLGLALVQRYTGLLKLDEASYYLSSVPIRVEWDWWLLLNVGTFVLILVLLVLPTSIVTRIRPGTSVRYE